MLVLYSTDFSRSHTILFWFLDIWSFPNAVSEFFKQVCLHIFKTAPFKSYQFGWTFLIHYIIFPGSLSQLPRLCKSSFPNSPVARLLFHYTFPSLFPTFGFSVDCFLTVRYEIVLSHTKVLPSCNLKCVLNTDNLITYFACTLTHGILTIKRLYR